MVMEAPPSPQSVGREFVRQYYTLLNKAPIHLHRFYNQQSSFVHGGLDPPNRETRPVIGQKQIHQKIQQLNFRDCHAKITQVDSQATLGEGVVVQVTGELSNAGQPMRRFTQTFVLASQSPKKYYVHNDIFRYQDEIISDEEGDNESRSEIGDEDHQPQQHHHQGQEIQTNNMLSGDVQRMQPQQQQQPIPPFYPANAPAIQQANLAGNVIPQQPQLHQQPQQAHLVAPPQQQNVVPTVNGSVHPEEINVIPGPAVGSQPPVFQSPIANLPPTGLVQPPNLPVTTPPSAVVPLDEAVQAREIPIEAEQQQQHDIIGEYNNDTGEQHEQPEIHHDNNIEPVVASNEPKTYANLLKSGPTAYNNPTLPQQQLQQVAPPQQQQQQLHHQQQQRSLSPVAYGGTKREHSDLGNRGLNNRGGPRGVNQPRGLEKRDSMRGGQGGGPGRNSFPDDGDERKRSSQGGNSFSDSNQLFLGNLPHNATEDDLREIFYEFGAVIDLRVHTKPNLKGPLPNGRAPPNYGFITFETQAGVQNCLAAKPIFFPKGDKNGTQLNVEEKKLKDRQSYGRPSSNDNRPPRDSGPRRSGGGGGGPGGPGGNRPIGGGNSGGGGGGNSGSGMNAPRNNYNRGGGGPPQNRQSSYNNNNTRR